MTRIRKIGSQAILVLAIVLLAISLTVGFERLRSEQRAIDQRNEIDSWLVANVELEFLRLENALESYASSIGPTTHEELVERLDIFWSRLPILLHGSEAERLRSIEGFQREIEGIQATMELLEPALMALKKDDAQTFQMIRAELRKVEVSIHQFVADAMIKNRGNSATQQQHLKELYLQLIGSFGGILVSGTVLIVLLFREIRKANRLVATAQEAQVRASAARTRLFEAIESISEGFALCDADDRLILTNTKFREFFGAALETVDQNPTFEDFCRATATHGLVTSASNRAGDWIRVRLEQHRNPGAPIECEGHDGAWLRITERKTGDGGNVGVYSDISAIKRREEDLAASSSLLQGTLENIGQGLCVFDSKLQLVAWNTRLLDILDLPPDLGRVGLPYAEFLEHSSSFGPGHAAGQDLESADYRTVNGEIDAMRYEIARPDGTVIDVSSNPMPGGGFVATFTDITDRKQSESERGHLIEQIAQSQKMQAVGTLAGGIAHDFNNVLSSILGFTQLALEDARGNEEIRDSLDEVMQAGNRGKELVQQILAFSRGRKAELVTVDMQDIVKDGLRLLSSTLPKTIEIKHHVDTAPAMVLADPTKMHQVLINLCINASHAIGANPGTIELRLENVNVEGRCAESLRRVKSVKLYQPIRIGSDVTGRAHKSWLGLLNAGPHIRLTVADTGSGMDRDTLARIFEPFYTTKVAGEGTGLGLSALYNIVIETGGALVVASEIGKGTRFEVYVPRIEASVRAESTPRAERPANGNESVLVVDDEESLVRMVTQSLQRLGYKVDGMSDPLSAVEAVRIGPDRWDLVITDQTMPGMTGDMLAREILRIRSDMPIILCTGFSQTLTEESAKASGIREFLHKPIMGPQLAAVVRRLLDDR